MGLEPFEIVLDAPGKNAMSSRLMSSIRERLREAAGRPVLLTGAGDALSAGLDLKEVAAADAAAMADFLALLEATVSDLYHYRGPTVICVNGHAIAGGCVLTLACDHRVSTSNPKARIGLNEVALGVRFPPGVLAIVRRRLPVRHLERVLLGGALHDPRMALELGLVDEISDEPLALARERLLALAAHPAESYAALKERLHEGASHVTDEERRRYAEQELSAWTSPELKARLNALLRR
jgi:enoyl-CoA hydratase